MSAACRSAAKAWADSGERDITKVATLSDAAMNRVLLRSVAPRDWSVATARLTMRPVSLTSPGAYQRLTVKTPDGVRCSRKIRQASTV